MLNVEILPALSGYKEFKCCGPLHITYTAGNSYVTLDAAAANEHDFINDIVAGTALISSDVIQLGGTTVLSVDTGTRRINLSAPLLNGSLIGSVAAIGQEWQWSVPTGAEVIYATFCGGGQGGAGGGTGGGGGGGGASATFIDIPIIISGVTTLSGTVGCGCRGGLVGEQPSNNGGSIDLTPRTQIFGNTIGIPETGVYTNIPWVGYHPLPTGRPDLTTAGSPDAGGAADGGAGGNGAPMYNTNSGPAGGTAGTGAAAPGNGSGFLGRGLMATTGGAGGGGSSSTVSGIGFGGADLHIGSSEGSAGVGVGGIGGCAVFGEGGLNGLAGNGYGAGGGGGDAGQPGGDGAPGILIFRW